MNLGLDLRGGAHLLLAMEVNDVRKDWLETLRDDARRRLREAKIGISGLGIASNAVQVRLAKAEESDAALKELKRMVQPLGNPMFGTIGRRHRREPRARRGSITITPTEAGLQQRISNAIAAAIETVRRRVDAMGTTEPNIVREGTSRILVQVPGLSDTAQLKELIGKTARLSFHEVHPALTAEEAQANARAARLQGLPGRRQDGGRPGAARDAGGARRRADRRASPPSTSAPTSRSSTSASTTRAPASSASSPRINVGKPFAIVLDDKVISAPVIREPILGGSRPDQRQLHGRDRQRSSPSSCAPARCRPS